MWIEAPVSTHKRQLRELLICYGWAHIGLDSAKKRDEIVENEGTEWMRRERTKKWKILDGKFKFYFCITFSPHVTKIQSRDRIPPYHTFSFCCKSLPRFLRYLKDISGNTSNFFLGRYKKRYKRLLIFTPIAEIFVIRLSNWHLLNFNTTISPSLTNDWDIFQRQ